MEKVVEVKEGDGSVRIHLSEGENMSENMKDESLPEGLMTMMSTDRAIEGRCGCACRPPVTDDVSGLYKALKSGIQSAKDKISRRPDWNIKKKGKK